MSESDPQVPDANQHELSWKREEQRLREREVVVKERDSLLWRSPLFLGLLVAALSLCGNAYSTIYQAKSAQKLASAKTPKRFGLCGT